jgi:hypothetical protein
MAIAAKISSAELTAQVTQRFVGAVLEARLINAPGVSYIPGTTNDATFLGFEVPVGTGGYSRQAISYDSGDVSVYSDDGVALTQRATVFTQDGTSTSIDFSHVALVWGTGNVLTLGSVTAAPSAGVDGTYTNIPVSSTSGSGSGLVVDLTITNSGALTSDYALTIAGSGSDYSVSDTVTVSEGTLAGLGAVTAGAGDLTFSVASITSQANAGTVLSVAQTSSAVVLGGGNQAAFYWNLKQFGYYSTSA